MKAAISLIILIIVLVAAALYGDAKSKLSPVEKQLAYESRFMRNIETICLGNVQYYTYQGGNQFGLAPVFDVNSEVVVCDSIR